MMTMKMIAFSLRPNQRMDKGSQLMLGRDCIPSTRLPNVSSIQRTEPIAMPIVMPITKAIENPMSMRCIVVCIDSQRTPLSKYRRNASYTVVGSGSRYGDQRWASKISCQSSRSAP